MIEGKVADKLIRKYPQILHGDVTPELREQINTDEVIISFLWSNCNITHHQGTLTNPLGHTHLVSHIDKS